MIIGITGGIGGGKTTLSNLLRSEGYAVYDSDFEAKRLQNEDEVVVNKMKALLGEEVYEDGQLNRKAVAERVFNNLELLKQLTDIVHPAVIKDFSNWKQQFSDETIAFMESAVLFEGNLEFLVDKIILVTASEDIRIQRVINRDGISKEQVIVRIKNQIPDAVKAMKSDLVIDTAQGLPENVLELIVMR